MRLGALEEDVRAYDVRVRKVERVAEREVDVRLSCKVEYRVDRVGAKGGEDGGGVGDVAVVERKVGSAADGREVVQRAAVVELVEDYEVVVGIRIDEVPHDPGSAAGWAGSALVPTSYGAAAHMKPAPPVTRMFLTPGRDAFLT